MYCASCGQGVRIDSLSREYEQKTRAPYYLYSGTILVCLLIAAGIVLSMVGAHQRDGYIKYPQVGDVYLVKRDLPAPAAWYFLRIAQLRADTAVVYHSHLEYSTSVYQFNAEDYFVSDEESKYSVADLKAMYQKGIIATIFRDDDNTAFSRVK